MRTVVLAISTFALATPAHAQSLSDLFKTVESALASKSTNGTSGDANHPRYDVTTFDVAGVKLGMTPEEVEAALTKRGFAGDFKTVTYTDFSDAVRAEAQRRKQPMPQLPIAEGRNGPFVRDSHGNTVSVDYVYLIDGPRVSQVRLNFNPDTNDLKTLNDDVVARYGTPTLDDAGWLQKTWCPPEVETCESATASGARLAYRTFIGRTLTLRDGGKLSDLRKAQIAALFQAPTADRQRSLLGS